MINIRCLSTMLQIKSNRPFHLDFFKRTVPAFAAAMMLMSCASTTPAVEMEPKSVAKQLNLSNCKVSVPLTQIEVVEFVKKWYSLPNPEKDPEWAEIVANQQPGDQLRMVTCEAGDPYFYALIRNGAVIYKFHPVLF